MYNNFKRRVLVFNYKTALMHFGMRQLQFLLYRFMSKMKNFTIVEEDIVKFLCKRLTMNGTALNRELKLFLEQVKQWAK